MAKNSKTPLKGNALLKKIDKLKQKDKTRREIAKECGYFTDNENEDETRVNLTDFYEAVLAARGIELNNDNSDGRGRDLEYRVTTHKNGQIVIGASYTEKMGLKPGDEFEIKLGSKHIHLKIIDKDDKVQAN